MVAVDGLLFLAAMPCIDVTSCDIKVSFQIDQVVCEANDYYVCFANDYVLLCKCFANRPRPLDSVSALASQRMVLGGWW